MDNKKYHNITLRRSTGFGNGERIFTDHPSQVMIISEISDTGGNGRLLYLFDSGLMEISPGDRILHDGKEHEITEVMVCRDIAGKIRAVRCTTLN